MKAISRSVNCGPESLDPEAEPALEALSDMMVDDVTL
jgi:hypothetical protein